MRLMYILRYVPQLLYSQPYKLPVLLTEFIYVFYMYMFLVKLNDIMMMMTMNFHPKFTLAGIRAVTSSRVYSSTGSKLLVSGSPSHRSGWLAKAN